MFRMTTNRVMLPDTLRSNRRAMALGIGVVLVALAGGVLALVNISGHPRTAGKNMQRAGTKLRIVFLCVENANRSQMAEAFARMYGGAEVVAHSAGSKPRGEVNPKAIAAMKELGYDLLTHRSKGLGDLPPGPYDVAVTMGCGDECPAALAKRRIDWEIPDPKTLPTEDFNRVRDLIGGKVKELLAELGVNGGTAK
jgi:arsenate reductase